MAFLSELTIQRLVAVALTAALATCSPSTPNPPEDLTVSITAEPSDGLAPLTVRFSAAVSGGTDDYSYVWDFGDGVQSRDESAVHVFDTAGEFTVHLTVTDTQGAEGEADVTIIVGDDHTPVASASVSPSQGIAPLFVSFTGSAVGGDEPLTYTWSFGDGSEEVEQQNPTHTYEQEGTFNAVLIVTDDDGDQSQAEIQVLVVGNDVPLVEIEASPMSGIAPLTVGFTAVVMGGDEPINYAWDFGDGETSVLQAPTHLFETAGSFTVSVTVTDANGDTATDSLTIEVGDDNTPTVAATASPESGLVPLPVDLRATVTGGNEPVTFLWDFGDGSTTSELQNPSHTYTIAGSYNATVIVTDNDGDTGSDSVTIEVGSDDIPSATASATPVSGIEPLTVSFTGNGIGGNLPLTYSWNFGDGSPLSTTQSPTHVYETAGAYTATLIVTDDDGDGASDEVLIEVASNETPVVEASADPLTGIEPLTVGFAASVSGGNAPMTYDWDFGDGSPHSSSANPSHTYAEGTFTATVTVTDTNGDTDSDSVTIEVGGDDVPSVAASAVPTFGFVPLPVAFSSTVVGGNAPFTYSWNFGDGGTSTDQNPSHTYTVASTYTVIVTVRDVDGDVASDTVTVNVSDDSHPIANASASPIFGVAPLMVSFFGSASGGDAPLTYEWSFGDGSPNSTDQNPSHTYDSAGSYSVTLIVRDADGDSDSDTVTIDVSDDAVPLAFVNADPSNGLTPLDVDLHCGASGGNPPLFFQWTFGDGSPPDEAPDTSHRYEIPGTFTATCTVTDDDGDSDSDAIVIHVGDTEVPAVDGTATPAAGRFPLEVELTADVVGGTAPYSFLWDFDDGETSTEQNPTHTYDTAGVYYALVQVTDFDGDTSTDIVEVRVLETSADLEVTDFHVDVGVEVTYTVTVTNNGPDPMQNFWVDIYYDETAPPEIGDYGDDFNFVSDVLDSGSSRVEVFTSTPIPGSYQAYAAVDIDGTTPDTDRTNNIAGPVDYDVFILVINEFYYDGPGADGDSAYVEIFGVPDDDLSDYVIAFVNGSDGSDTDTVVLPAGTLVPADGLLVVAASGTTANADVVDSFDPQNGPDSLQLRDPGGAVVDAVAYGDFDVDDFPAGEGTPCGDAPAGHTIGRDRNGTDTDDNATDFVIYTPTPGETNTIDNDSCVDPFDITLNPVHYGFTTGLTNDYESDASGGCEGDGQGPDVVFDIVVSDSATYHFDTIGSDFYTILYVRSTCDDGTSEIACDESSGDGMTSMLEVTLDPGHYYIIVDGEFDFDEGNYVLNYWTL